MYRPILGDINIMKNVYISRGGSMHPPHKVLPLALKWARRTVPSAPLTHREASLLKTIEAAIVPPIHVSYYTTAMSTTTYRSVSTTAVWLSQQSPTQSGEQLYNHTGPITCCPCCGVSQGEEVCLELKHSVDCWSSGRSKLALGEMFSEESQMVCCLLHDLTV